MQRFSKFLLFVGVLIAALFLTSCRTQVVYDEYSDDFRHKPENEWDYFYQLENPKTPQIAEQKK